LVSVSQDRFQRAWALRKRYQDKSDISFTDFTSMVVMEELGIVSVFSGDHHFSQVNMDFQLMDHASVD
jgi:predicted nucleic acid-binding protein